MSFRRTIEDFTCEQCGADNIGDGYTNHCRVCLYSKHVDISPGDRLAECGGLMAPVGAEIQGDRVKLLHRCLDCGHEHRCRTAASDDWDAIVAAASHPGRKTGE
jgi:predicted RNA-binding Zn-ribbon protein involved in translation (DUF1610 family)